MNTVGNGANGYQINQKQEQALRDWLQEAIVPLIEQVLVKKLGQAMSFAAEQLVQPKREWQGLTDDEIERIADQSGVHDNRFTFARTLAAKLREKNTGEKK